MTLSGFFFLYQPFLFLFLLNRNKSFSALGAVISFALIFPSNSPLKRVCAGRLPGRIQENGLGAEFAFLLPKFKCLSYIK